MNFRPFYHSIFRFRLFFQAHDGTDGAGNLGQQGRVASDDDLTRAERQKEVKKGRSLRRSMSLNIKRPKLRVAKDNLEAED